MATPDFKASMDAMRSIRFRHAVSKIERVLKDAGQPPPALPGAPALTPPADPGPATTVDFNGIPVAVDRPRGFVQDGVDDAGTAWRRYYYVDYGAVPNTLGGDGDGLDVYVGLDKEAPEAHWILQKKADGSFDEYKVMLGFNEADYAKAMYLVHTPKRYFGSMYSTSLGMMKALLNLPPTELMKALAGHSREDADARIAIATANDVERIVKINATLAKADAPAELRYVLGTVLEPETTDGQGDIYSADEIRKACWEYMAHYRNVGLLHKGLVNNRVKLVENFLAPQEFTLGDQLVKAGTWLMGLNVVDNTLWTQVKSGDLSGLSIGGFSRKTPLR